MPPRPPSTAYRVHQFVRRNRLAVTAGAVVARALMVAVVLSSVGSVQAKLERDRAARLEREANASAAEAKASAEVGRTKQAKVWDWAAQHLVTNVVANTAPAYPYRFYAKETEFLSTAGGTNTNWQLPAWRPLHSEPVPSTADDIGEVAGPDVPLFHSGSTFRVEALAVRCSERLSILE